MPAKGAVRLKPQFASSAKSWHFPLKIVARAPLILLDFIWARAGATARLERRGLNLTAPPLDMHDTYFNLPQAKYERLVKLYGKVNGQWRPQPSHFGNGPTKYIAGSSGSMSTAHDYIQFEQMLLNKGELNGKRLLKPESVALMSTNQTGDLYHGIPGFDGPRGSGFGLTVRVMIDPVAANSGRRPGAFGWVGAYGTTTWTDPADEMTVAMLVQQAIPTVTPDFEHAIRKAVVA